MKICPHYIQGPLLWPVNLAEFPNKCDLNLYPGVEAPSNASFQVLNAHLQFQLDSLAAP